MRAGSSNRRDFLKWTTGLTVVSPTVAFRTRANSALTLGIIGCGGRGNFIGQYFQEYAGARIVALADPFEDRIQATIHNLKLTSPRIYRGLEGYKDLLASNVDAVAIMSPPYFHPEQTAAAVAAGKHVFVAKPIAVDVAGCLSFAATGKRAEGKLSLLVDFQTRAQEAFQEAAARVHRGDIGELVLGHVYYHAGRLPDQSRPDLSPEQNRLRNWVFDKVLSGDIIVEQNIHVLDVANWYIQAHPLKAVGTGGRKARVDVGDCWDHFLVLYEYPKGIKVDFSSAQFTRGYSDLCIRFYGTKGTVDSHYRGPVRITGDNPWTGKEENTFTVGAANNVRAFVESIRSGRYLNNAAVSVQSNLTAILGRMAAYAQREVTWDEMLASNEKFDAHLAL